MKTNAEKVALYLNKHGYETTVKHSQDIDVEDDDIDIHHTMLSVSVNSLSTGLEATIIEELDDKFVFHKTRTKLSDVLKDVNFLVYGVGERP